MLTSTLVAALLASHPVASTPIDWDGAPSDTASTTTHATRLDGIEVDTQSGRVQVLTDSSGNRRFLFESGEIIAVDSSGKTWTL